MEELQDKKIETGATTKVGTGDSPTIDTSGVTKVVNRLQQLPRDALRLIGIPSNQAEREMAEIQKQQNALAQEIDQRIGRSKTLKGSWAFRPEGGFVLTYAAQDPTYDTVQITEIYTGELKDRSVDPDENIRQIRQTGRPVLIRMTRTEGNPNFKEVDRTIVEMENKGDGKKPNWIVNRAEQGKAGLVETMDVVAVPDSHLPHSGRSTEAKKVEKVVYTPSRKATTVAEVSQFAKRAMFKV